MFDNWARLAFGEPIEDPPVEPTKVGIPVATGKKAEMPAVGDGHGFDPGRSFGLHQWVDRYDGVVFTSEDRHWLTNRIQLARRRGIQIIVLGGAVAAAGCDYQVVEFAESSRRSGNYLWR